MCVWICFELCEAWSFVPTRRDPGNIEDPEFQPMDFWALVRVVRVVRCLCCQVNRSAEEHSAWSIFTRLQGLSSHSSSDLTWLFILDTSGSKKVMIALRSMLYMLHCSCFMTCQVCDGLCIETLLKHVKINGVRNFRVKLTSRHFWESTSVTVVWCTFLDMFGAWDHGLPHPSSRSDTFGPDKCCGAFPTHSALGCTENAQTC